MEQAYFISFPRIWSAGASWRIKFEETYNYKCKSKCKELEIKEAKSERDIQMQVWEWTGASRT